MCVCVCVCVCVDICTQHCFYTVFLTFTSGQYLQIIINNIGLLFMFSIFWAPKFCTKIGVEQVFAILIRKYYSYSKHVPIQFHYAIYVLFNDTIDFLIPRTVSKIFKVLLKFCQKHKCVILPIPYILIPFHYS